MEAETSFAGNNDGTVTITLGNESVTAPGVEFVNIERTTGKETTQVLNEFIRKAYKRKNFRLSKTPTEIAIRLRTNVTENGNLSFKEMTSRGKFGKEQIVLKRGPNGKLVYNKAKVAEKAVGQFKSLLSEMMKEQDQTSGKRLRVEETETDQPHRKVIAGEEPETGSTSQPEPGEDEGIGVDLINTTWRGAG